ncbi:DNA-binding NarL/FixJ family response regulator [Arthrobacter sp. JUb119]|uniref:response regulator transcription factor n=1 Tax=Micrococcales TaxID=85006 RepID=UPI000CFC32B5|nr:MULTISPECIES: response regulator transcription factor [unclassified Arthrobacter]MCS3493134.1 DNA-binding NarL/FixJ family response regulator [Arthrobacter sp. JUb119]PQZ90419.1 DNA-binding response regulator [Arthrobacter sp. MYb222]PRB76003.1 DNA-binding response regulator [Arthrobacter sp. MYb214]TDU26211.1 LuxR family two component transcriptional regulator [Arthrobacter sp. JUb115]
MRVLICEDSVLLREGLVRLLAHSGHHVVADLPETSGLMDFLDNSSADDFPQVCILDVRLPPTYTDEGIRAALELRKKYPDLPVLVLSQYVEERYASELISTQSGAIGYLLKDRVADVSEFIASLEQIAGGGTVLDQEVVAQLLTRRNHDDRMQKLTDRERTVLAALAEGKSNQAIAALLFLSEASVEKYITSIFQKLGLEADGTGNRRVLAALAHIETLGTNRTDRTGS